MSWPRRGTIAVLAMLVFTVAVLAAAEPSNVPSCEAEFDAVLASARQSAASRQWDDVRASLRRGEELSACHPRLNSALFQLGQLYQESFELRSAERIYEKLLATATSERSKRIAESQLDSLRRGFPPSSTGVALRRYLGIDPSSTHSILVFVATHDFKIRVRLLSGTILAILLLTVIRLRDAIRVRDLLSGLSAALPLGAIWFVAWLCPVVLSVGMYKLRITIGPIAQYWLVYSGSLLSALGIAWLARGHFRAALGSRWKYLGASAVLATATIVLASFQYRTHIEDPVLGLFQVFEAVNFASICILPVAALVEEYAYRAKLWSGLKDRLGPWTAGILSSAIFALAHRQSWPLTIALFGLGELFRWVYGRGGLAPATLCHWGVNIVLVAGQLAFNSARE